MIDIYSQADDVIVSLRDEKDLIGLVMLYFHELAKGDEPHEPSPPEDGYLHFSRSRSKFVTKLLPAVMNLESVRDKLDLERKFEEAFRVFFQRPYWTRIWIIQEVIAAKRIRVYCVKVTTTMPEILHCLSNDTIGKHILKNSHVPDFSAFRKAREVKSGSLIRMMLLSRGSSCD